MNIVRKMINTVKREIDLYRQFRNLSREQMADLERLDRVAREAAEKAKNRNRGESRSILINHRGGFVTVMAAV